MYYFISFVYSAGQLASSLACTLTSLDMEGEGLFNLPHTMHCGRRNHFMVLGTDSRRQGQLMGIHLRLDLYPCASLSSAPPWDHTKYTKNIKYIRYTKYELCKFDI